MAMYKLLSRQAELKTLREYLTSDRSEFVAVYGRRRVGKTLLIRTAANDEFSFFVTGVGNASKGEQLMNFAIALKKYSGSDAISVPKDWISAFYELSLLLQKSTVAKKVIFIDELPWFDNAKSGFLQALENFWNSWASLRDDVKLIVCGSATSWMISKLIHNRGGLHNRLTHKMFLEPFDLRQTEDFFKESGFSYSRRQIAECYMIMGGVPYYLSLLDRSKSLAQNIDRLFFAKDAPLNDEFSELYRALFKNATGHIAVVTALSSKGIGLTRGEILKQTQLSDNGAFSIVLEELENCGFIRSYDPYIENHPNKVVQRRQRSTLYQLVDFYTLFYFKFIKNNRFFDEHFWSNSLNSPLHNAWSGISFEMLCLMHVSQIKSALGISGVLTCAFSWRGSLDGKSAQIDLLIDRKDETINICEIKYSQTEFEITQEDEKNLQEKVRIFSESTGTKKTLLLTLISASGLLRGSHSDLIQCEVTLDDLFA